MGVIMAETEGLPAVLIPADRVAARVEELGAQIRKDYEGRSLVVVAILKGSFLFAADLARAIALPGLKIDFMGLRSYGTGTESSGVVQITYDLSHPVEGEDVLVVEDIVDTGLSMKYLFDNLATRRPRSIRLCSLLHKPSRSRVHVNIDYLGFRIEDRFVVGYGMDHAEHWRHLPYIGVLDT